MDYYVSRYQGLLRHPWMHENHNTFSGTPKGRCHAKYCVIPRWYRSKKPSTFLITSSHARPFNWLLMRSNKIITAVNFRTRNHILLLFVNTLLLPCPIYPMRMTCDGSQKGIIAGLGRARFWGSECIMHDSTLAYIIPSKHGNAATNCAL